MGKSTISMAIFNIYVTNYQRVYSVMFYDLFVVLGCWVNRKPLWDDDPGAQSRKSKILLEKKGLCLVPLWYSGMPVTILYLMICRWLDACAASIETENLPFPCQITAELLKGPQVTLPPLVLGPQGNAEVRGISGGQRKRTSIAMELVWGLGILGSSEIPWEIIIATGWMTTQFSCGITMDDHAEMGARYNQGPGHWVGWSSKFHTV